jgi:hypothetical protein
VRNVNWQCCYRDETIKRPTVNATITKADLMTDMWKILNLVSDCYKELEKATSFTECIITQHHDDLPQYSVIYKRELYLSETTVERERAFSLQNRIKTKLRNRLSYARVDCLLTINTSPPIDYFDFVTAVRRRNRDSTLCIAHRRN